MNCFNIRELQGNLKRKFFTDLVNSNDHRDFLNQSILGMRFKNNNNLAVTPDMEAFYNFGTTVSPKTKSFSFTNDYNALSSYASTFTTQFSLTPNLTLVTTSLSVLSNLVSHLKSICELFISLTPYSVTTITSLPTNLSNSVACNLNHFGFSVTLQLLNLDKAEVSPTTVPFNSENISTSNITEGITSSLSEVTNSYRFNRFSNPLISYDYKCGHYLGIWDQLYPSLMTSYIEVARGIRKAPWFYSDQFNELLLNNHQSFIKKFTIVSNTSVSSSAVEPKSTV